MNRERTPSRERKIRKAKEEHAKNLPDSLKFILRPRSNWSKEQKTMDEIDPEELKKVRSDYIREGSSLMETYTIQDMQKRLFNELIPSSQSVDPKELFKNEELNGVKNLPIVKRESNTFYYKGYVEGVMNVLMDESKIKRKIKIPTHNGFNYSGIIIGPKGANQKQLEEDTGCKILIRGRGSQKEGQAPAPDDWEPLHVLIAGDSEEGVAKAAEQIEKIIFADTQTLTMIRQEQLNLLNRLKNNNFNISTVGFENTNFKYENSGIENPTAYVMPIDNEYISIVIGQLNRKNGRDNQLDPEKGRMPFFDSLP